MSIEPDPKTVREIARKHIQSGRTDVGTSVLKHFGSGALSDKEFWAWEYAVEDERRKSTVTVSWPDEQPQDAVAPSRPLPDDEEFISILQGGSFYAEVTAFRRLAATIGVEQTYRKWTKLQRRARTDAGRPLNEQPQDERDGDVTERDGYAVRLLDMLEADPDRFQESEEEDLRAALSALFQRTAEAANLATALSEAQTERDGATQAVAEAVSILEGMLNEDEWAYDAGRARGVLLDYFARDLDALVAHNAKPEA